MKSFHVVSPSSACMSALLLSAACTTKPEAVASAPPPMPPPVQAPPPPQRQLPPALPVVRGPLPGSAEDFRVNVGDTVHFGYERVQWRAGQ